MEQIDLAVVKEQVREGVNIEELLYYLGVDEVYHYRGGEIRCRCPIHNGDDPNFSFDEELGVWTCFSHGCGEELVARDVFSLVQIILDVNFRDSLRILADMAGVSLSNGDSYDKETRDLHRIKRLVRSSKRINLREEIKPINEDILHYYRSHSNPYIESRGFSKAILKRFEIGYAPDGEFKGRMIIPIRSDDGSLIGFSGRLATDDEDVLSKAAKYKNMINFKKGLVLYGLDKAKEAIEDTGWMVITEGFFDVMRAHEYGAQNTVAIMGTGLMYDQLRLVLKYTTNVMICLDNDDNMAGQKATLKIIRQLENLCKIRVMTLPRGRDVDDLSVDEFWDIYNNAKTPYFYRKSLERKGD